MARDPEAQMRRLQDKLDEVCEVIGLPLGGGTDGYLIPNLKRVVAERDKARVALAVYANEEHWQQMLAGQGGPLAEAGPTIAASALIVKDGLPDQAKRTHRPEFDPESRASQNIPTPGGET